VTDRFAYRLVKTRRAATAFDGEGAKLYGGRWNSIGNACVYLAESESLAILEVLVHLTSSSALEDWSLFRVKIPSGNLLRLKKSDLPADWNADPHTTATQTIGDDWLATNSSAGLIVPSTIAQRDSNIILNPGNKTFTGIVSTAIELDFLPDKRVFK